MGELIHIHGSGRGEVRVIIDTNDVTVRRRFSVQKPTLNKVFCLEFSGTLVAVRSKDACLRLFMEGTAEGALGSIGVRVG